MEFPTITCHCILVLFSFTTALFLLADSSSSLKHRKVKHFGYEFLYSCNNVDPNCPLVSGIPDQCHPLLLRLLAQGLIKEMPDQLTVNQYQPGQGEFWHDQIDVACSVGYLSCNVLDE